jgi:enoyl-CoA hydratase/carnithine racemase
MGLMPELGSTFMLPRLVGLSKALELVYTAKVLKGKEACEIGLVNKAVPGKDLMATVHEMAGQIAALPPLALAVSKRALVHEATSDFDSAVQTETFGMDYFFKSQDHKEAVVAFLEKREP